LSTISKIKLINLLNFHIKNQIFIAIVTLFLLFTRLLFICFVFRIKEKNIQHEITNIYYTILCKITYNKVCKKKIDVTLVEIKKKKF